MENKVKISKPGFCLIKKSIVHITIIALFVALISGCEKDNNNIVNTKYTVYTSGFIWNNGNYPCYWKGSERTDLPGGIGAFTTSIFVSEDTVYTAGYFINTQGKQAPCYWKGTTRIDLPCDTTQNAYTTSIFVSDGNVYTAGHYTTDNKGLACYWVNSVRNDLDNTENGSFIGSIYVSGETVYLGGYRSGAMGRKIPCYWIDNTRTDLPAGDSENGEVKCIIFAEGVVYTCGYNGIYGSNVPCFWKDLVKTDLGTTMGMAVSISVDNGVVYTAGTLPGTGYCYYWKNTTKNKLKGSDAVAICAKGGLAFTAGRYSKPDPGDPFEKLYVPCYWVGNTRVDLPVIEDHSHNSTTSIFVQ
jgi:hypothetical protein